MVLFADWVGFGCGNTANVDCFVLAARGLHHCIKGRDWQGAFYKILTVTWAVVVLPGVCRVIECVMPLIKPRRASNFFSPPFSFNCRTNGVPEKVQRLGTD